jgi:hypothetical protein
MRLVAIRGIRVFATLTLEQVPDARCQQFVNQLPLFGEEHFYPAFMVTINEAMRADAKPIISLVFLNERFPVAGSAARTRFLGSGANARM